MRGTVIIVILSVALALPHGGSCADANVASLTTGGILIGENRDDPAADLAGVSVTAGTSGREGTVAGEISTAMRRMLDGKTEITFIPHKLVKIVGVNPDQLIKMLPFSHYFSYIFDFTSKLPVKTGMPSDVNIAPFKVHVGNPTSNPNVGALQQNMLVKIEKSADGKGWQLVDPEGNTYTDPRFGVAQVIFHMTPSYWGPVITKLKEWYHAHFGNHRDQNLEEITSHLQATLGDGSKTAAQFVATFEDEKILGLYWKLFDRFKAHLKVSGEAFAELFKILRDIALTETIVMGIGDTGLKSVSLLYKIGNTLPFPNLEMIVKLIKDLWDLIRGLPHLDLGWPDQDVRISIITRYHNEQFVEVFRIFLTPREAAQNWHPSFLEPTRWRSVIRMAPGRAEGMSRVHAIERAERDAARE
jgi:hypothetical protein